MRPSSADKKHESSPAIEQLFTIERRPSTLLQSVAFLAYTPIGVILLLLRVILGAQAFLVACLLRKTMALRCSVLRCFCALLGIIVVEESRRNRTCPLIVANHVSTLDHMAVDLVDACILPSVWDIPNLLRWCLGYQDFGARQGRDTLIYQTRKFCQSSPLPLLAFPEGAVTNGRVGMLKFSSWPFAVSDFVQPVIISTWRPPLPVVETTVLAGSWWQDTLWFLFVPFTVFKLRWLPPLRRLEGESVEAFCSRVCDCMSAAASLRATEFTSQDAVECAKRHVRDVQARMIREAESQRRRAMAAASSSSKSGRSVSGFDLDRMTLKVKEVFPNISLKAIRADLDRTKNVEMTMSNVIDEKITDSYLNDICQPPSPGDPSSWWTTLEDRKWAMIEENRVKYTKRKGPL